MNISKISNANSGKNNATNLSKINYSATGASATNSSADSISFGTGSIDPATYAGVRVIGGFLGVISNDILIIKACKLFEKNNIRSGLEIVIALNDKIGNTISRHLTPFETILDNSAGFARLLPDEEYANIEIKQRFLRSVFLRKNKHDRTDIIDPLYVDKIPARAKILFKELDNNIYAEFKKDLLHKAVYDKKIAIMDTDDLLEGIPESDHFQSKLNSEAWTLNQKRFSSNAADILTTIQM